MGAGGKWQARRPEEAGMPVFTLDGGDALPGTPLMHLPREAFSAPPSCPSAPVTTSVQAPLFCSLAHPQLLAQRPGHVRATQVHGGGVPQIPTWSETF